MTASALDPPRDAEFVAHMEQVLDLYPAETLRSGIGPRRMDEPSRCSWSRTRADGVHDRTATTGVSTTNERAGTAGLPVQRTAGAGGRRRPERTNDWALEVAGLLEGRCQRSSRRATPCNTRTWEPSTKCSSRPGHGNWFVGDRACHTPKHGRWLNIAENELSSMTRRARAPHRRPRDAARRRTTAWSWTRKVDDRAVNSTVRMLEPLASSAESVGEFWFGQVAKCVIQSELPVPRRCGTHTPVWMITLAFPLKPSTTNTGERPRARNQFRIRSRCERNHAGNLLHRVEPRAHRRVHQRSRNLAQYGDT